MDQATTDRIKAGTLANLHDLWLFDVSERQRTQRAAEAAGYGFDAREFARPFPGSSVVQVAAPSTSRLGPAVLAAAALLGGLGLGGGGAALLSAIHGAAAKAPPAAAVQPLEEQEYEVIFESAGQRLKVERP